MGQEAEASRILEEQRKKIYKELRERSDEKKKSIYDEVAAKRKIAHSGGYKYIGSSNLSNLDREAGGFEAKSWQMDQKPPKINSTNVYNHYYNVYHNGASRMNWNPKNAKDIKPDYVANPMQSTNLASSLGWDAGLGRENMDPLFNLYHKDTNLYLEEANAPIVKVGDRTYRLQDYDPNKHFMDWESQVEGLDEAMGWDKDEERRKKKEEEKKKIYDENRYLYEWRVAEGIEAAKEWEKLHGNHLVSMDKAVAYANGYMDTREMMELTEEQLYALEEWAKLSQVRDMMDDYLTKYGENGKFNQTNLKRIDAAMDRFVEYDPRIGTKLSYIMHRWVRGIAQTGENILDTLELWKLSNATTQVVVDETSGAVRATDEIQAKKEKILGDDKYDRMRAKDGARFNLSSKEQRVGEVAEAIGKGTPAAALLFVPGVGPIISALVTWGSTAGANAKQMWKEGEGEVSADKAIGYGTLSGAIEGAVNYFGNRLFDASTLKGVGNRVVAQMAETSGGQALLNTFGATIADTGMELFTTILKDEIKTWYNPKAEKMSEEELQKMIYTSLVANLVINGMQNFVAYQKGLVAETGPSEAEERAMMRSMAGEELEAEVPRSRPQAEEAEMMGTMEENIRGRAEAEASGRQALEGGANEPLMLPEGRTEGQKLLEGGTNEPLMLPEGRTAGQKLLPEPEQKKLLPAGEVDEQELIDTLMDNTGQKAPAGIDAEMPKGSKAGGVPQIEGAKDRTAEEIAGAIAQESGIPITTQAAQPGVTNSSDIIDYYVGANKKTLPAKYKEWIGDNKGKEILGRVMDSDGQNAVKQLYRGNSFIGDGGTADAIRFERATGLTLGKTPQGHIQKAQDMVRYLQRILEKPGLTNVEQGVLQDLLLDWEDALK